jgi:hypothetical protein
MPDHGAGKGGLAGAEIAGQGDKIARLERIGNLDGKASSLRLMIKAPGAACSIALPRRGRAQVRFPSCGPMPACASLIGTRVGMLAPMNHQQLY